MPIKPSLDWDTEIDTPATIAVIGGGPCGVEAALYARFLGYSVELYEKNKIGDSLLAWGDRSMPAKWSEIVSSLGLAALEAHEHPLPNLHDIPSAREYVAQYLLPLARCDLLLTSANNWTRVLSLSRLGCDDRDTLSFADRAEQEFRLLATNSQRGDFSQVVDLILDCSGGQSTSRLPASGGGQPIGWSSVASQLTCGKHDIAGKHRSDFSGKRVLLFGNNQAAVGNAVELADLVQRESTQLYWVIPKRIQPTDSLFEIGEGVSFLTREEVLRAQALFQGRDHDKVVSLKAWGLESIKQSTDGLLVTLHTTEDETLDVSVDKVIYCGSGELTHGYHHSLHLDQPRIEAIVSAEPHFYYLGDRAAMTGENVSSQACPFVEFRDQIRRAFALIGGRAELDLYQTVKPQTVAL